MNQEAAKPYRAVPSTPKAVGVGVTTSFEMALRFNKWAQSLTVPLTPQLIQEHYDVSRATSYRWLRAYRDACVSVEQAA